MRGTSFEGIETVIVVVSLHLDINVALVSAVELNVIERISAWERELDVDSCTLVAIVKESLPVVHAIPEHRVESVAWRDGREECKLDFIQVLLDRRIAVLVCLGHVDVPDIEIIVQVDANVPSLVDRNEFIWLSMQKKKINDAREKSEN